MVGAAAATVALRWAVQLNFNHQAGGGRSLQPPQLLRLLQLRGPLCVHTDAGSSLGRPAVRVGHAWPSAMATAGAWHSCCLHV